MKICNKCQEHKKFVFFSHKKDSKDGYSTICKVCKKEYDTLNHSDVLKRKAKYRLKNRETINSRARLEYSINPDNVKEKNKEWVKNNLTKVRDKNNRWAKNNPIKIRQSQNNWLGNNPHITAWRNVLNNSLKRFNKDKEGYTIDLLGYSALELKNHITSLFTEGMSWDNYGEWHIDHKISLVNFTTDTHPSIINKLANLQPLWATTREINGTVYVGNLNKNKY